MSAPGAPVTAFLSWAHQPNPGLDPAAWRDQVLNLATGLRANGISVDVDLFHLHDLGVDWSRYGPGRVAALDFTLVAVNAAWRERFEDTADPTGGAGAAAEADELLGLFARNREEFNRKVKLIVLPGANAGDVPPRLSGVQRFTVAEPTSEALQDLRRTLTGQPEFLPPPLGSVSVLPPETRAAFARPGRIVRVEANESATASEQASVTVQPTSGAPDGVEELDVDIALLRSALRQRPPAGGPDWQRMQRQLVDAQQRLAELEARSSAASTPPVERLAELVDQVGAALERGNRCWLIVVAAPSHDGPGLDATDAPPSESTVERRRRQLQRWAEQITPIPPINTSEVAIRQPRRVSFTGALQGSDLASRRSARWRLELSDDGSAAAAAVVGEDPQLVDNTGVTGWAGESVLEAEVFLPVRRDLLETWLLTELELLVNHVQQTRDGQGQLHLLARLEPPTDVQLPQTHGLRALGVRIVDEKRDLDGQPIGERPPAGAGDLPFDAPTPISSLTTVDLPSLLADPARLVQLARKLAVELLEHFGVEQTAVLRPEGTLDALGSAWSDQMAVHQHARQLGLPVDPDSPADRRRLYAEKLGEARAWLKP